MAKPRKVKVVHVEDPINWWNREEILGVVFDVVAVAPALDHAQTLMVSIEYEPGRFGWLPLKACEVNPHLRRVK